MAEAASFCDTDTADVQCRPSVRGAQDRTKPESMDKVAISYNNILCVVLAQS